MVTKATKEPRVIRPATHSQAPATTMTITCRQVSRVPEAQYTDRSFPSLIHIWEKR